MPGAQGEPCLGAEGEVRHDSAGARIIREEGIESILDHFAAQTESKRPILFCCSCSREKAARAVLSLGREAAERIIKEDGEIVVHCHECNTDHRFQEEDIRKLFDGEET